MTTDNNSKLRCLIQFMMSNGCVEFEKFHAVVGKILGPDEEVNDEQVSKLMNSANKRLNPYNMMIRTSMDEITTEKYCILISTVDNDITHAATKHNPKQIEFFKLILQNIILDPCGIVPIGNLRNYADTATLPSSSKYRSCKHECEQLFREWCDKHWFTLVSEGGSELVTLGVRSIAELDVFIKQNLITGANDLDCTSCQNMAIYAVLCPSCESRFHKRCSKMSIDIETGRCRKCSSSTQPTTSAARSAQSQNVPDPDESALNTSSQNTSARSRRLRTSAKKRRI